MKHELADVPIWALIPFVVMLLTIAIGPLFFNHWWEKNKNKLFVSIGLAVPVAIFLIIKELSPKLIETILLEYVPFIVLLGALFVITGGINIKGDLVAKPTTNLTFLAIGAVLASFMGTTGAAMLLIRPVIKTNSQRKFKVHTILFFIAIVANAGGLLTPLGDPPLFLLYLNGAPFTWFFTLTLKWFMVNALLLIVYFIVDSYYYKKEDKEVFIKDKTEKIPLQITGTVNFIFLLGVVLSVAFLNKQFFPFIEHNEYYAYIREIAIVLCALGSLYLTPKTIRKENNFTWDPIKEVAYLFLGIFVTMVPALLYLEANAKNLGVTTASQFYYASGALSSFLDNAPTALSFYNLAIGMNEGGVAITAPGFVAGIPEYILAAISMGAVLFGSMTYIGNGPNFMVKAIAEENKISMPSFFAYIFKFSIIVLLPIYILVQLLFIH